MIGGKYSLYGALVGFLTGILFIIISIFQYDVDATNLREVISVGIFFGIPFSVVIGYLVGWIFGKFFSTRYGSIT